MAAQRPRLLAILVALLCAPSALPAAPAHAEAPLDTVAVLARAHVTFTPITGGWHICADGSFSPSATVVGTWTFAVAGARELEPFTEPTRSGSGPVFHSCTDVIRDSDTGVVVAALTYTAVGSYVLALSVQGATWEDNTGVRRFGLDPRP